MKPLAEEVRECLYDNIDLMLNSLPYSDNQIIKTGRQSYYIKIKDYSNKTRYIKIDFAISNDEFDIKVPLERFALEERLREERKRKAKRNGKD